MGDDERTPLPSGWRQKTCPQCGGELKYAEMIFSARWLHGWDENGVLFISDDYEDFGEGHDDEHLYCTHCLAEWALPESIEFGELELEDKDD